MRLVDTHSHLHFSNFNDNRPEVYERAVAARVTRILCVGTTLEDSATAINYAQSQDGVWAAVGVHPHEAAALVDSGKPGLKDMQKMLGREKVVAVGEIGLDYYKSTTPKDVQEKALRLQLEAGLETKVPFSFHVRDAWSDFWRIIDDYQAISGVVHSFASGRKQLDAALNRGLYVGLNGIMTITRDQAQLEAAKLVPLNKLLLETDAPFLSPAPFRNETCEPKHVAVTAEFLAELRHESLSELAEQTTSNSVKLFNL